MVPEQSTLSLDKLFEEIEKTTVPYFLSKFALATSTTGSRVICNPPVMDTDFDIVVLLGCADDTRYIEDEGYIYTIPELQKYDVTDVETDGSNEHWIKTYRKGDINLICLIDPTRFGRWKLATAIAKRFNLKYRDDRIALFKMIKEHQEFIAHPKAKPHDWTQRNADYTPVDPYTLI